MRRLLQPLWIVLAVLFLIEAWFWERLRPLVAALLARIPWRRLRAWLVEAAARVPGWLAAVLFLVPFVGVEPLKAYALILMAEGNLSKGAILFAVAQIVALGLCALLFDLFRPQLMAIGWFARAYHWCVALHRKALALVAPARLRVRLALRRIRRLAAGRSRLSQKIASLRRWARRPFRAA